MEYDEADDSRPPVIRTTFMGLYGVDSPLPTAYLDDIAQHREGHEALQGLLDIFSHRIMTQFYRIWRKYRPPPLSPAAPIVSRSRYWAGGARHPRHDAAYRLAGVALSGANRRAASAGQNPAGDPALVTLLAPETTVRVSPYSLRPVAISQPLGFTAMTTSSGRQYAAG